MDRRGRAPGSGPSGAPTPGPGLAGTRNPDRAGLGPERPLKMSTGSQRSSSSQLKHRISYPLHGVRAGNRLKVRPRARARVGWTGTDGPAKGDEAKESVTTLSRVAVQGPLNHPRVADCIVSKRAIAVRSVRLYCAWPRREPLGCSFSSIPGTPD
jgi:hypothetical protein